MRLRKIHFFLLLLLNLLLPLAIRILFRGVTDFDISDYIGMFIAILVVSFIFFFLFWFLYYIITGGKEPSVQFHLLSQCFTTACILGLFAYFFYPRYYPDNHQ